jgi:hypothetical protein
MADRSSGWRDRHCHAWRGRVVGPERRRQGRRLPTRPAPRAEPTSARRGRCCGPWLGFDPISRLASVRATSAALQSLSLRWARRPRLRRCSDAWRYLESRGLPDSVLTAAAQCDVIREGPRSSTWFAHRDPAGLAIHVDVRGPTYKGSLTGGCKSLFCFSHGSEARHGRLVLADAAIDALSRAAIERLREDTIYAATGGGMGPSTIAALEALLLALKTRSSRALPTPIPPAIATPLGTRRSPSRSAFRSSACARRSRAGTGTTS